MKNYDYMKKVKSQNKSLFFIDECVWYFCVNLRNGFFFALEKNLQGVAGFPVVDAAAEFEIEKERKS